MTLPESIKLSAPPWLNSDQTIVLSHRLRLVRNLERFSFTHIAENNTLKEILELVEWSLKKKSLEGDWSFFPFSQLSQSDLNIIQEYFFLPMRSINEQYGAIAVNETHEQTILVNSQHHLKISLINTGEDLVQSYLQLNLIEEQLSSHLSFSFHPVFGYLSPSPADLGTGLKISYLLHLPAINLLNRLPQACRIAADHNSVLRTLSLNHSSNMGNLFVLEYFNSFGPKEESMLAEASQSCSAIRQLEEESGQFLQDRIPHSINDKVKRSWGILTHAELLDVKETFNMLSALRLGTRLNYLETVYRPLLNRLLVQSLPYHLSRLAGFTKPEPEQLEIFRAGYIRKLLHEQEGAK